MRSANHFEGSRVEAAISAADRRRSLTIALEQAAAPLSTVLGAAILMLLVGTNILAWYWVALLALSGLALIAARVRSHSLQRYRLAQILDHRLKLSDSLSTAWFLMSQSAADPIARIQIAQAEQIAREVRPAAAFPFAGRRAWALAGVLAALAFGLFAVRYLVTRSLSLQQALIPMHFGPVLEALERPFSASGAKASPGQQALLSQPAQPEQHDGRSDTSIPRQPKPGDPAGAAPSQLTSQPNSQPDAFETAEGKAAGADSNHNAQSQPQDQPGVSQSSPQTSEQATAQQSSPGLVDKMKDALSSLMAKMRLNSMPQQPGRNGERSGEEQKSADQSALGKGQHGNQPNAVGDQASREQTTDGQAQGQTAEKAQTAQGRNADSSAEHKGSDSQSGIGHQDGEKELREAEQLRAMGKLAEIIGKRSASLTGDMTLETPAGKQQLKTEYSGRLSHHSDLGGEINRDEIPLIYQQYIRDYMEEVRKRQQAPPP